MLWQREWRRPSTGSPLRRQASSQTTLFLWFDSRLIGDFCLTLKLPPVHVLACGTFYCHVAVRFPMLFPDLCRSLILTGTGVTDGRK